MNYNNPRLGRFGSNNLYGGYSNTYGQYAGYGDYDYGGSSYSPAQSKSSYGSYSGGYNDCPGIPIALLLVTLLGIGVMGFILFTKIQGAGRKKRDAVDSWSELLPEVETLDIILLHGLEEFEEKIDKIAEGQDHGEDNWISRIYNQFSFFNDVDNSLADTDMDGIEPPMLDETWGLGIRNSSSFKKTANTTIEEPVKLDTESASKKKREVIEDEDVLDDEVESLDTEEKCRVDMWRCLSHVIEGGLHYIDNPEGLYGLAKKTMFKVAFHGGVSNVWSGLMTIPEARQIKKCMNNHQKCISYEVLRREAQETMDPTDPSYGMYDKKMMKGEMEKEEDKKEKKLKRERLIINPEFVESLSQTDGSEQYDDYSENEI